MPLLARLQQKHMNFKFPKLSFSAVTTLEAAVVVLSLSQSLVMGCDILSPQTQPDLSTIPWGWLTGKIAFVNQDEGEYASGERIYIIDPGDRSVKSVVSSDQTDDFVGAFISPRGDQIAYNELSRSSVLDLGSGTLTRSDTTYVIGYTRHNFPVYSSIYGTHEMIINGNKVKFAVDARSNIAFGPGDAYAVYCTPNPSGYIQLVRLDPQDSSYHFIGASMLGDTVTAAGNPDISEDGKQIVYTKSFVNVNRGSEIWIINMDGSNDHKIISGYETSFDYAMWSPDDKHVVCSSTDLEPNYGYGSSNRIMIYSTDLDSLQQLININGDYTSWTK